MFARHIKRLLYMQVLQFSFWIPDLCAYLPSPEWVDPPVPLRGGRLGELDLRGSGGDETQAKWVQGSSLLSGLKQICFELRN